MSPLVGAALRYTGLRLGIFLGCLAAIAAVVLPTTDGPVGQRLVVTALAAAVASIPLSLLLGRRLRAELAAQLAGARDARAKELSDYDARIRAARDAQPHAD